MNNCPYCGSSLRYDCPVEWRCGSVSDVYRSRDCLVLEIGLLKECVKKERDQLRAQLETLKAERNAAGMRERNGMLVIVEKWKAYAERLEEAGDLMHWYCADPDAVDVWNQAKEAKP